MSPQFFKSFSKSVFLLLAISLWSSTTCAAETRLKLGPRKDVTIKPIGKDVAQIAVTGPTPHFWSQPLTVPKENSILAFDYFSATGTDSFSVRFRDSDGQMVFVGSKKIPFAETWQPFAIELSKLPTAETRFHFSIKPGRQTSLQIRNFRLRSPDQAELTSRKNREKILAAREADSNNFLSYLGRDYPGTIERVEVGQSSVHITGRASQPVRLVELPAHVASHVSSSPFKPLSEIGSGTFEIELPRFAGTNRRDRALSRWRLESQQGKIASLARWPTAISVSKNNAELPRAVAKSQKGIGGVPTINRDDHPIFELGVHHATVNFVIDALMSREKTPGRREWKFEGRSYYINGRFLAGKDATIRRLCANDIVVTCILLVGNRSGGQLKHPESESRGIYSMPNLTTEVTAHHYRAAMEFLAERYSKPERRIANWVMHNEVDQAGTWTNMGNQPLARYLEAYHRSARIVYHTARKYDPHARIFISLTHHWAKPSSGHGTYTVRELIKQWEEIARAEGHFEWGVAYHPYPQDLRNPDTWDDRDVTFDHDTPYITPKNIEVLPKFLGPHRPILLSEQGFNTPTLSLADQRRQSKALIYTFKKLEKLPTIEAFHLHRFQDMPDREGGLRLGVMDENGNRKLGWHTYKSIGTDSSPE